MGAMHWDWQLALEFVKALAWPVVVSGAVIAFRRQIAAKIGDLKETTTPLGGASFFDRGAGAARSTAEAAEERQEQEAVRAEADPVSAELKAQVDMTADAVVTPAEPEPERLSPEAAQDAPPSQSPVGRRWREEESPEATFRALTSAVTVLDGAREFGDARRVAADSPRAGVLLAYAELERVGRAAWTVAIMGPPRSLGLKLIVHRLIEGGGLDPAFGPVMDSLALLRNLIVHGEQPTEEISVPGALDFIQACEQLARAMTRNAMSKLRHPSRSQVVGDWIRWTEQRGSAQADDGNSSSADSEEARPAPRPDEPSERAETPGV